MAAQGLPATPASIVAVDGLAGTGGYYGHRRYGGYWPWLGVGAGLALAATWPFYGGYGYDDCVQWRPDWGWVNVCGYQYGGYYPY